MNIGQASNLSGVSSKMIRYYESVGLLPAAARRANGYRDYGDQDVAILQFVRRTRDLGFSLEEVSALLTLWRDKKRSSREVKRLAEAHIADLQTRIREMRAVMKTLRELGSHCHGDERSECPILDDLANPEPTSCGSPATIARRAK
jgi:Cu(I)-responsive transcriptional regulator